MPVSLKDSYSTPIICSSPSLIQYTNGTHFHTPKNKRILRSYKDALLDLARPNVHYKTKKLVLVQEGSLLDLARPNVRYKTKKRVLVQVGSGFIEDLLASVVSSVV